MTQPASISQTFHISPLIRITLISLYVGLTIPLPILSAVTQASVSPAMLWGAIALGLVLLWGALSETVNVDDRAIAVTYPRWFFFLRHRAWSLPWSDIAQLKMRTTGQGGQVYYLVTQKGDRAYLLPMRVLGFSRLVRTVTQKTGIDTQDVKPLAQPWMYFILLGFSGLLLLIDTWVIWTGWGLLTSPMA